MNPIGVYLHIPFCAARCTYCDFNVYVGLGRLQERYARALVREIELTAELHGRLPVRTIYFGGGTPTLLSLNQFEVVLRACTNHFSVTEGAEISVEGNPDGLSEDYLCGLRVLGVNRLSLGAQVFDDAKLRLLGRTHSAADIATAVECARRVGFDNLNLDLIYGLPDQSLADWQATLNRAIDFDPDHISCYALQVEEHTALQVQVARGRLPAPDPDLTADMYDLARARLAAAGFCHYEISNWARSVSGFGFRVSGYRPWLAPDQLETRNPKPETLASELKPCEHNLIYWRNEPYLGLGAGAHGWFGGERTVNELRPRTYMERVEAGELPVVAREPIDLPLEMAETVFQGLRLVEEGLEFERFARRFGRRLEVVYGQELRELRQMGLITVDEQRVRLAPEALLVSNEVFERFLPHRQLAAAA